MHSVPFVDGTSIGTLGQHQLIWSNTHQWQQHSEVAYIEPPWPIYKLETVVLTMQQKGFNFKIYCAHIKDFGIYFQLN